eukprot:TRINITY_DN36691_c0_g1_i2.p1 TRINITY_DN36691_c0_g1~~TRINITY_DN36691_c0_g1_i2.p1  ORF type:complete len:160 (+),score=37.61 TRINITY_DN36691_c0_g1_i2:193-672(+)
MGGRFLGSTVPHPSHQKKVEAALRKQIGDLKLMLKAERDLKLCANEPHRSPQEQVRKEYQTAMQELRRRLHEATATSEHSRRVAGQLMQALQQQNPSASLRCHVCQDPILGTADEFREPEECCVRWADLKSEHANTFGISRAPGQRHATMHLKTQNLVR